MVTPLVDREPVGVHIMDDAVFARECLRSLLEEVPRICVSSSGTSMQEARPLFRTARIHVVIVSPHQLDPSGSATVRAINRLLPAARVITIRDCRGDARCSECIASGADACFDRSHVFNRVYDLLHNWFQIGDTPAGHAFPPEPE